MTEQHQSQLAPEENKDFLRELVYELVAKRTYPHGDGRST